MFDDPIRNWQELLETHLSPPVSSSNNIYQQNKTVQSRMTSHMTVHVFNKM